MRTITKIIIEHDPARNGDRPFVMNFDGNDGLAVRRAPLSAGRVITLAAREGVTVTDEILKDVADGNPYSIKL